MSFTDLKIPPGLYANGTPNQTRGAYVDSNLCRDYGDACGPIGGWRQRDTSGATITGAVRAMLAWSDSDRNLRIALGSHSNAYAIDFGGTVTDITPAGYVTGRADADTVGGYGSGTYGTGVYGEPREGAGVTNPATQWDLDSWDGDLIGCAGSDDGKIYAWDLDVLNDFTAVPNAPTDCVGCVVTGEKFLVAIQPKGVAWSDQGDREMWTPAADNQAGSQDAQTAGTFVTGRAVSGATLIFSTVDVWSLTYRRDIYVFDFLRVEEGCGIVSKRAAIAKDTSCYWMSYKGFWQYNGGAVFPLPCSVAEKVFSNINALQISKVHVQHLARQNEIWWFYPSSSSTEIDRVVVWNYVSDRWWVHNLARTAAHGADGIFELPLAVTSANEVMDHEVGTDWDGDTPYLETGVLELGAGDQIMEARWVVGDEKTQGEASIRFVLKDQANGTETETDAYELTTTPTPIRWASRQARMRVEFGAYQGSRFGYARLDLVAGGWR